MASKHFREDPKPEHPRFIPTDVPDGHAWAIDHRYYIHLVRETLTQAYALTPWDRGVVILTRPNDFQNVAEAVALVAGPVQTLRVYVKPSTQIPHDKRVMIDPSGRPVSARHPLPWGDPPAPEEPPPPMTEAEWKALTEGNFPEPVKP